MRYASHCGLAAARGAVDRPVLAPVHGKDHHDQRVILDAVDEANALLAELDLVEAAQIAVQGRPRDVGIVEALLEQPAERLPD